MRIRIMVSVAAERAAVLDHAPGADVVVGGVGPAASAAVTAATLVRSPADLVLCAGIGGGFGPLVAGDVAVASSVAFADLGAQDSDGSFLPLPALGLDGGTHEVPATLAVQLADRTGGHLGTIVTVATVTGTAARTGELLARYPDAVAEGMEGAGVAAAAALTDVPFAEIRAISNVVGPRDRSAWQLPVAFDALGRAVARVLAP